ncbi:MAG: hypothetical protein ABH883_08195 [Candidatus Omnitrophota bacterium]
MKSIIRLYLILVLCVFIQTVLVRRSSWFPDIILLAVVFSGIFAGGLRCLFFSFVAGLFRGALSSGTLFLDIIIFPFVAIVSSLLSKMFYRQNPAVQVLIAMAAVFVVVVAQTLYLNIVNENNLEISAVLMESWKPLMVTVFISPLFFSFVKLALGMED